MLWYKQCEEWVDHMSKKSITCASRRNVEADKKVALKRCNFFASSIPSFGDAVTRRPLTTGVLAKKELRIKYNRATIGQKYRTKIQKQVQSNKKT